MWSLVLGKPKVGQAPWGFLPAHPGWALPIRSGCSAHRPLPVSEGGVEDSEGRAAKHARGLSAGVSRSCHISCFVLLTWTYVATPGHRAAEPRSLRPVTGAPDRKEVREGWTLAAWAPDRVRHRPWVQTALAWTRTKR